MSRAADPTVKISLLRAAEEVFAEKGLEAAKVQDITERAGTSKGAFYLHFQSKEEAFRQVVESFLARCMTICSASSSMMQSQPGPVEEMLAEWTRLDREVMEFFWQNRGIVRVLPTCQGEHLYLLEAFHEAMEKNCISWLEAWKKARLLRDDLNSTIAAAMIGGAWHELMHKTMDATQKPPFDEWLDQMRNILVRGMGTPALLAALDASPPASKAQSPAGWQKITNRPVTHRDQRRRARA